jgi:chaperonin GroES
MIKPGTERIVVKPAETEKETKSGLIISSGLDEGSPKGTVVAVGPGRVTENGVTIEPTVSVGDVVYYIATGGHEAKIDGETLVILKEDVILAIVEE